MCICHTDQHALVQEVLTEDIKNMHGIRIRSARVARCALYRACCTLHVVVCMRCNRRRRLLALFGMRASVLLIRHRTMDGDATGLRPCAVV